MTPYNPNETYDRREQDEAGKIQSTRVAQYNGWSAYLREVIDSILRHVNDTTTPKAVAYVIDNGKEVRSWSIVQYDTPTLVNLMFDGRLVIVESREFYPPPKRKWWQWWKKDVVVTDYVSPYTKRVVAEISLTPIDPSTPWQEWDRAWQLRRKLFLTLVRQNSLFHLPSDEFMARLKKIGNDPAVQDTDEHH